MTQAELEDGRPGRPWALVRRIRDEIGRAGAISFGRFMELALYAPGEGYYEREEVPIGRHGDFQTSVSVGSLFGELLAFQFTGWAEAQGGLAGATSLQIVEAGAHDGRLAADILGWLRRQRPELFGSVGYWIVEPSPRRQGWQQKTLAEFSPILHWSPTLSGVPPAGFRVLFCNELLDALPVRRLGWDAQMRSWFEWGVGWEDGRFAWMRLDLDAPTQARSELSVPQELLFVLPDGHTIEICPAAEHWWRDASRRLGHGKLVAIDYGLSEEEFFSPHRPQGTLRAYRRHQQVIDPLASPGEQDLTAQVNFGVLRRAGEAAGLKTDAMVSQARFLTGLATRAWVEGSGFGAWTARYTRQFQTLTHPDHFGHAFRVLVQAGV